VPDPLRIVRCQIEVDTADRTAKRHGHENGSMTLGRRRVPVNRPRIRTADDEHELPVASYEYFADRDR